MPSSGFLRDERAVNPGALVAAAILAVAILGLLLVGALLGESAGRAINSGAFIKLEVQVLDSNTLKLEHLGGDALDFEGKNGIYLYQNGVEHKLETAEPSVLEVGGAMKISLPEGVEIEKGNSALFLIKDEKKKKEIYRKEISS
ncbi:hypothetical protein FTO70_04985 [Methanosarcina sp. KYL-1]|uniref:hypothetical protein n=1 Tax=Methanosarcina sp. KYL-1 TaxID=2602068 RepID=UPI0021011276|nr:hypothetical protein [Methanosarcina sp. KYL-1]MCQ1535051.1 hypothetical protein [Methanosarcina sp. KYL-1]